MCLSLFGLVALALVLSIPLPLYGAIVLDLGLLAVLAIV
jgi:hypothetical protein